MSICIKECIYLRLQHIEIPNRARGRWERQILSLNNASVYSGKRTDPASQFSDQATTLSLKADQLIGSTSIDSLLIARKILKPPAELFSAEQFSANIGLFGANFASSKK